MSVVLPSVIGVEVYFFGGECSLVYFSCVIVDDSHFKFFPALLELFDGLLAVFGLEGCLFLDGFGLGQLVLLPVHEVSAELWFGPRGRQLLSTRAVGRLVLRLHASLFKFGS